jgi:HEAT repeat protein
MKFYKVAICAILSGLVVVALVLLRDNGMQNWYYNNTHSGRLALEAHLSDLRSRVATGPGSEEALDEMIALASADQSFVRSSACGHLGLLGSKAQTATPTLILALKSDDPFVEKQAAIALGKVAASQDAVDALINKMRPFGGSTSIECINALGEMGKIAVRAIPDLEEAAQSADELVADRAKKALTKLRADQR